MSRVNYLINTNGKEEFLFRDPISLTLVPKETILLYGNSGIGKTTLLKLLAYLIKPSCGDILFEGTQIKSLKQANALRSDFISIIPSQFYFFESLSVLDNILVSAYVKNISSQKINEKLTFISQQTQKLTNCNLHIDLQGYYAKQDKQDNILFKKISELSNSQREMVMLARALLLDARYIFADELFRSFDTNSQHDVFNMFMSIIKEWGLGLFLISHNENIRSHTDIQQRCYIDENRRLRHE